MGKNATKVFSSKTIFHKYMIWLLIEKSQMILCLFSQFRELTFGETFLLQVEVKLRCLLSETRKLHGLWEGEAIVAIDIGRRIPAILMINVPKLQECQS